MSVPSENLTVQSASPKPIDKRNRSFASQKLVLLRPLTFAKHIEPASTLIFLHIPKAGGTNVSFVSEAIEKINTNFKSHRFSVPRVSDQSPNRIVEDWRGGMQSAEVTLKSNPDFCKNIQFIRGHFPFGIHVLIKKPARYIALIRNPIERELSATNFDYQRGYVDEASAQKYLLEQSIDNPQTRLLAGSASMSGACTVATLAKAKENIETHFLLVGITEETNDFIQVLASIQNWGPIALCKAQVTGEKVFQKESAELVKALSEKHAIDMQLYNWVKDRWHKWKAAMVKSEPNSNNTLSKILCIKASFAAHKTPELLSIPEIEAYNRCVSDELLALTQTFSNLPTGMLGVAVVEQPTVAYIQSLRDMLNRYIPPLAQNLDKSTTPIILDFLFSNQTPDHTGKPEDCSSTAAITTMVKSLGSNTKSIFYSP